MATKLIDANGSDVTSPITIMFVCDECGNTTEFWNGMSVWRKTINGEKTNEQFCSEICVRKNKEKGDM